MITPTHRRQATELVYGRPGLSGATLYDDMIEISGSPNDSDDLAGEIVGTFTMEEARELLGPHLHLDDGRTK